jgi:uncharacterized protein (TIRG00374 family)
VRYAIGAVLAGAALYASFRGVDGRAVLAAMREADWPLLVAAVGTVIATISFVTWRWAIMLRASLGSAPVRWRSLWDAVVMGQAVNIVFPLRFGEGARVASTCASTGLSAGRVVMAMAVERACDIVAFTAVVLMLTVSGRLPARFKGLLPGSLIVMLGVVALLIASAWIAPRLLAAWATPPAGSGGRARPWIARQLGELDAGWRALMHGPRAAAILALTAVVFVSSAATNYFVFQAFALPVRFFAAFVLLAVLQVGTAVVSVPGNVGIFQYLTMLVLASWGVSSSTALAVALVLHIVSLGPRVALGAIAAAGHTKSRRTPEPQNPRTPEPQNPRTRSVSCLFPCVIRSSGYDRAHVRHHQT